MNLRRAAVMMLSAGIFFVLQLHHTAAEEGAAEPAADAVGLEIDRAPLVPVQLAGGIGYMDDEGTVRIPGQFAAGAPFVEGRAAATREYGNWGYIDRDGNWIVEPQYAHCESYRDGVGRVKLKGSSKTTRYLDKTGDVLLELPEGEYGFSYSSGVIPYRSNGREYGVRDLAGNVLVPPQYLFIYPFSEGAAVAGLVVEDEARVGLLSTGGEWLVPPTYLAVRDFSGGAAPVKISDHEWAFVGRDGARLFGDARFHDAKEFSEGLAAVARSDGRSIRWGFINREGRLQVPFKYKDADLFSNGLAAVEDMETGLWGYIDHGGVWVIAPAYSSPARFHNGLAQPDILHGDPLDLDRESVTINRRGERIMPNMETATPD